MKTIPRYISTFDLEEARLGQAIEKCRLQDFIRRHPEILKKTLTIIKNESVNAEYALDEISKQLEEKEKIAQLIQCLLEKKSPQ